MTLMDWIAALALSLIFVVTVFRTELLHPRVETATHAPYLERLAWDAVALAAVLRAVVIFGDVVQATGSEATLCVAFAIVATLGMLKTLYYGVVPRIIDSLINW